MKLTLQVHTGTHVTKFTVGTDPPRAAPSTNHQDQPDRDYGGLWGEGPMTSAHGTCLPTAPSLRAIRGVHMMGYASHRDHEMRPPNDERGDIRPERRAESEGDRDESEGGRDGLPGLASTPIL